MVSNYLQVRKYALFLFLSSMAMNVVWNSWLIVETVVKCFIGYVHLVADSYEQLTV